MLPLASSPFITHLPYCCCIGILLRRAQWMDGFATGAVLSHPLPSHCPCRAEHSPGLCSQDPNALGDSGRDSPTRSERGSQEA